MTTATASAQASRVRPASRRFDGDVHRPGDQRYDELRRPLDPALNPRPALVVEAMGTRDAQQAVLAARDSEAPVSVQATGHGLRSSYAGGVLINTSAMSTVLVDPDRRIARVGAGATWGQVIEAAAPFGLAPLSGSAPSVGVTGFTLGGGIGWLSRRHGFAADSVVRAEVVTAAGNRISVSADDHPDLFWALRGGGGSLGVVTGLEFRLHPVAQVYAGTTYFPFEKAAETLAAYRDWAEQAPDDISTALLITRLPETGRRVLALRLMHAGDAGEAERLIAPLRAAAGPALLEGFSSGRFGDVSMGGTAPRHLDLFERLPDDVLDFVVEAGEDEGLGIPTIEIRHWGGAMARPEADAGPVSDRRARFSVIADSAAPALAETLRPHALGGTFLNFLSDTKRTASAYTAGDWQRLREVKATYDPQGVFSRNHVIG
jgi:FAD/FMN-containing dehydrogenase